ncbi:protein FAR-RED ELONGATED HYPOCOTYL 3-like, partial [Dorcoceras hygrometricum]
DEFEKSWEEVIKCTKLETNDCLSLMYGLRHRWVPAYFNHVFSAGMSSSQRAESSHSFFLEFQSEMSESHGYQVKQTSTGVEIDFYDVINFQCSSSKPRVLMHDKLKDYISCSCTKFDFEGIPCRHMLAFFRINQVFQFPDKYILKRWTQDAKVGVTFVMCEENVNNDRERFLMSRHSRLSFKASVLVDEASLTDEGTKFLDEQFDHIYTKIKYMNSSRTFDSRNLRKRTMDGARGIIDPAEIRTKGRGKRMKSSKEKSTLKSRQCRGCGLRGVSHDKRNCPKLQDGSVSLNLCMFYSFFF